MRCGSAGFGICTMTYYNGVRPLHATPALSFVHYFLSQHLLFVCPTDRHKRFHLQWSQGGTHTQSCNLYWSTGSFQNSCVSLVHIHQYLCEGMTLSQRYCKLTVLLWYIDLHKCLQWIQGDSHTHSCLVCWCMCHNQNSYLSLEHIHRYLQVYMYNTVDRTISVCIPSQVVPSPV